MKSKKCIRCEEDKPLSAYYKHKQMGDGHLNKCKDCTKKDTKSREDELKQDPVWVEKEKKRAREKYHRLNYKGKHKPDSDRKREINNKYKAKYPEKHKAKNRSQRMKPEIEGNQLHHWSYKEEHWKDVIELSVKDHNIAHRYMTYDQERMMYRRLDGVLLDTRESHEEYIKECVEKEYEEVSSK